MNDIAEIRRRSGRRNPNLDINIIPEPFEVFVYQLRVPGYPEVEVHLPIEWVSVGGNDQIAFSADGMRFLRETEELVRSFGPLG